MFYEKGDPTGSFFVGFYFKDAQLIFLSILIIKHLKFFCFHV